MIGKRLGRWRLVRELGRGGMGRVYLAEEERADGDGPPRQAAVKVLSPALAQEAGFVHRFRREIEALRRLDHPHIVRLFDAGEADGWYYCAMEFVDGQSLEQVVDRRGRMPWNEVVAIAIQTCAALKHAHDHGIVHRDLKPANLFLQQDGTVKLLDFGIAKVFSERRLTATDAVVGTADYLSPEQAAGKPVTPRSDLYSLGVVLYLLLTGRTPFRASSTAEMLHKHRFGRYDPPRRIVPEIPHDLDRLVCELMEKDPMHRPADAAVVGRALERIHRKAARSGQNTTDQIELGKTIANGDSADGSDDVRFVYGGDERSEEDPGRHVAFYETPLFRAAMLMLLIAAGIALLIWGLWPDSVEDRLGEVAALVAAGQYADAAEMLREIPREDLAGELASRAEALEEEIEANLAVRRARRRVAAPLNDIPPRMTEAERFYREGLHLYASGKIEAARRQWQLVVTAFANVPAEAEWVRLAEEALNRSQTESQAEKSVREAIRLAGGEPPAAGRRRLEALRELYRNRTDPAGQRALDEIEQALEELTSPSENSPPGRY